MDAGKTLKDLIGREYRGEWICDYTHKLGAHVDEPKTHLTYGFATQVVILDDEGKIKKVVAAHDVGKVMNPMLLHGQIEGSLHMGLGYALTEDFVVEGGHIVTDTIKSIRVLRAHQMPELEVDFRGDGRSGMSVRCARRGRAGFGADGSSRGRGAAGVRRH